MNDFSISLKINGQGVSFGGFAYFETMFEAFLGCIEDCVRFKRLVEQPALMRNTKIISTDVMDIIKIGAHICDFGIMFTSPKTGECLIKIPVKVLTRSTECLSLPGTEVNINIVGNRQEIYSVFPSNQLVSNMKTFFQNWGSIVNDACPQAVNSVGDEKNEPVSIDMNLMMQYDVRTELKRALELIDTNPSEAKKILMVMDYMFTKGNNNA